MATPIFKIKSKQIFPKTQKGKEGKVGPEVRGPQNGDSTGEELEGQTRNRVGANLAFK